MTKRAGDFAFAPRGVPHTLANHSDAPATYVLVITPAGFERYFARIAADPPLEPPEWALQPIPEVTRVGPQIAWGMTRAIFIAPFDELSEPGPSPISRRAPSSAGGTGSSSGTTSPIARR